MACQIVSDDLSFIVTILEPIYWQQFSLAFFHLKMFSFFLHSWSIFFLKTRIWGNINLFSFGSWKMLGHFLLSSTVSDKKSAVIQIAISLIVLSFPFKIFFGFNFQFNYNVSEYRFFRFILLGVHSPSWICRVVSFAKFEEI